MSRQMFLRHKPDFEWNSPVTLTLTLSLDLGLPPNVARAQTPLRSRGRADLTAIYTAVRC